MKMCQRCGAENPEEAMYCIKCGVRLEVNVSTLDEGRYFKLFSGLMLMVSVSTLLDLILNRGILTLVSRNLVIFLPILLAAAGSLIIIYSYFSSSSNIVKYFKMGSLMAGLGYLIIYIIPLLGGFSLFYPVWIIYLFMFLYVRRYE